MGNSEVGHLNIGAGRVVYQDLTRISLGHRRRLFFENTVLKQAFAKAAGRRQHVHLLGLVSDGGVHSDMGHLKACLDMARARGRARRRRARLPRRTRHAAAQRAAASWPRSSVHGRDRRRPLRHRQRPLLRHGPRQPLGPHREGLRRARVRRRPVCAATPTRPSRRPTRAARTTSSCCRRSWAGPPSETTPGRRSRGADPGGRVKDGDVCLFFNFRPDRARQLTRAFFEPRLRRFRPRPQARHRLRHHDEYKKEFPLPVAFPPERPSHVLAEVLAEHGLRQLHIAETEKYAHVTFFFNGGVEHDVAGRGAHPRAQPARRADLRPQARDERLRRHRASCSSSCARGASTSSS